MRVEFKLTEDHSAPSPPVLRRRGTAARLVADLLSLANGHGVLVEQRQVAWASVTFTGTRHELVLRFDGDDAVGWRRTVDSQASDHEFAIPGQLVAEVAVVAVDTAMLPQPAMTVRLDVLMLEDG